MTPSVGSRIYLDCFPQPAQHATFRAIEGTKTLEFVHGFDVVYPRNETRLRLARDFLTALLLHEKVSLPKLNVLDLVEVFGFEDTERILRSGAAEVLVDNGFNCGLTKEGNTFRVTSFFDGKPDEASPNRAGRFERRLESKFADNPARRTLIFDAIATCAIPMPRLSEMDQMLLDEIRYDFGNRNVAAALGIASADTTRVTRDEIFRVLRLLKANKVLVFANVIGATAVHVEAGCKDAMAAKISPALRERSGAESIAIFSDVFAKKEIPDLGILYTNGAISVEDVLRLRQSIDGITFREWIFRTNYRREAVLSALLRPNYSPTTIEKMLRWITPAALKLSNTLGGQLLATTSSFLLNKFLNDWNPNLFLDQQLAHTIDERLVTYHERCRREAVLREFGKVGRNDLCPCGSGKKFKRCHGAIL